MTHHNNHGHWDVIVVGTGMGGATLGHALAQAGRQVLFCEQGIARNKKHHTALDGNFAETFFPHPSAPSPAHHEILAHAGRWTGEIEDRSGPRPKRHIPFIGAGTGGSSALYGMALERFFPQDFHPRGSFPNAPDASLPEKWPIDYDELRPYYRQAEALYRVAGSLDPLRTNNLDPLLPPPKLAPANQELFDFLQSEGLHPYELPLACDNVDGCPGCQGYLCARGCKNDSGRICLTPALDRHGAKLLDQCRVLHLESDQTRITGVVCEHGGERLNLRANLVVLAAGALETPCLLLRSKNEHWPKGLANGSGLVGRNLMRHYIDLFPVFPNHRTPYLGNVKQIAFNDFLLGDGTKLGTIQSFGILPPAPTLVASMIQDVRDGALPWLAPLLSLTRPALAPIIARTFRGSIILAAILEDLPYYDNRVRPGEHPGDLILNYQIHSEGHARIAEMRTHIKKLFKPYRQMLIKQAENNDRIAHVCGTCRFGTHADQSVLNRYNRAHQIENLYIVDSSFFPSSGGLNPALTIAANALRVADHLLKTPELNT